MRTKQSSSLAWRDTGGESLAATGKVIHRLRAAERTCACLEGVHLAAFYFLFVAQAELPQCSQESTL